MEEKQGVKLGQDDLDAVTGGDKRPYGGKCYFTPTGKVKEVYGQNWAQCSAYCGLVPPMEACSCHDIGFVCTDKWHKVDEIGELFPHDAANHKKKPKSNNYNT